MTNGPICSPRCLLGKSLLLLLLGFITKNYYASIYTVLEAIIVESFHPLLYELHMSCEIFKI